VYANVDELVDFHRMIYVFVCVSEVCIDRSDSLKVFSCVVQDQNPNLTFASDADFSAIKWKSNDALETTKYAKDFPLYAEDAAAGRPKNLIVLPEFLIETDYENAKDTNTYLKQSARLQTKQKQQDEDDDLEAAFITLQFGGVKNNEQQAEKLLAAYRQQEGAGASDDDDSDDSENDEETKEMEIQAFEDFAKDQSKKYAQISDEYKLFSVVTASNPKQVLRYSAHKKVNEPLWTSNKKKLDASAVPVCAKCGHKRTFEFQLTPQLFDFLPALHCVDWEVIAIYTCSNWAKCQPDFLREEYYSEEFGYIQFSEDFEKVQRGTEEQIRQQKEEQKKLLK